MREMAGRGSQLAFSASAPPCFFPPNNKLNERLDELDLEIEDNDTLIKEQTRQFETIHRQTTEIHLHAKHQCQNILRSDLDFSDKVNFWHERVNAWRAILNQRKARSST